MNSTAKQLTHLRAIEQAQQSLEFAAVACSLSSCILRCSAAGSRRQLSIRKNERKGESDEPDAPLLGEGENSAWEGDVVIERKESDQANNTANDGFHGCGHGDC